MLEGVYTLGVWRVRPGREAEFITSWKELGRIFAQLPQPPSGRGVREAIATLSSRGYRHPPTAPLDRARVLFTEKVLASSAAVLRNWPTGT